MRTTRLSLLALVVAMLAGAPDARGAPMYTDFATIRREAATIVIGTAKYVGKGVEIDVDQVVRGAAALGPLPVKPSPDGTISVNDGERVVAFIDGNGAMRWVGRRVAGPSIEAGVLQLSGFFDFNAHIVAPGLMSLAQLRDLLNTGKLDQTFEATLTFPDGHGGMKRSAKRFTVLYDAVGRATQVQGLAPACLGQPRLHGPEWGSFDLHFQQTCAAADPKEKSRSLDLEGAIVGLAPSGAIQVEATPRRPVLYEAEYDRFVADPALADLTRVVQVGLPGGAAWSWRLDGELIDPKGGGHAPKGGTRSVQQGPGFTQREFVFDFDGAKIKLVPAPNVGSGRNEVLEIVSLIEGGTIAACTFAQKGKPDVTCTLRNAAPIWVKR